MPVAIQISVSPETALDIDEVGRLAVETAGISGGKAVLRRKSLDARGKYPVYHMTVDVYGAEEQIEEDPGFVLQNVNTAEEVHIVGAGPAGLFAALQCIELGLKPVLIERGKSVQDRRRDLKKLIETGDVNPDSNYCFGEGGAGTYSDGKLYTRSNKRGPIAKVLKTFCDYGAVTEILYDAHPHIGTNKLPGIIEKMRSSIIACGGEFHFEKRVSGFQINGNRMESIRLLSGEKIKCKNVILATGHSARDIFELLHRAGILIEEKSFAIGVRIEHPQEIINDMQYRCETMDYLPPASYNLVEQVGGRGVFSFCMCPGGIIAPAATQNGEIVVNGWSPSKRNGPFANSGFVVTVDLQDFKPFEQYGPLQGVYYQSHYEQLAYQESTRLQAPAQRMEDFIQGKNSPSLPACSYLPGIVSRPIKDVLSPDVHGRIKDALVALGKKKRGYRTNEAVLVGVESRTSSPVKIPRNNATLQHNQITNLYPCGEGAGYAGGIMSAALDGMRVALALNQNKNQ